MPDPFTVLLAGYITATAPHWLEDLRNRPGQVMLGTYVQYPLQKNLPRKTEQVRA